MKKIYLYIAFFTSILLSFPRSNDGQKKEPPCPPKFEPYIDERCFKLVDELPNDNSYWKSNNHCDMIDSNLPVLNLERKQRFMEEFLKRKKLKGNKIWLALKFVNGEYKWNDGTAFHYSNWQEGFPTNNSHDCIQFNANPADSNFGKWSEEHCEEDDYLIVCDKIQLWSIAQLQVKLINSMKTVIPDDFVYTQYPWQQSPQDIWPWLEWSDISDKYNSTFFRVLGSKSANFGEKQGPKYKKLCFEDYDSDNKWPSRKGKRIFQVPTGSWSEPIYNPVFKGATSTAYKVKQQLTDPTIFPANMAVRIWKRLE